MLGNCKIHRAEYTITIDNSGCAIQDPGVFARRPDLDIIHSELRAKDLEKCGNIIEGLKKIKQVWGRVVQGF